MPQETYFFSTSQQSAAQDAKKRRKRVFVIIAQVFYLLIIGLTIFTLVNRNAAVKSIAALDFQGAVTSFTRIPLRGVIFPKDDAYISAAQLVVEHQYDDAVAAFEKLTDDPRAEMAASETKYQKAVYYYTSGDFEAASTAFKDAGEYRNSVQMEQDSRCQLAAKLVAETEYDEAFLILQKLIREKYEPATQQMYLAYLSKAELFASKNDYAEGFELLIKAEKYGDVSAQMSQFQESAYQEAVTMYRDGDIAKPRRLFTILGDYLQAKDYLILIKARDRAISYTNLTQKEVDKLISLVGFEDAAKLVLEFEDVAVKFLEGKWMGDGYYFSITDEGVLDYNLPTYDYGDYYKIENGRMLVFPEDDYSATKPFFRFTIVSEDKIIIYAYSEGINYTLYRR